MKPVRQSDIARELGISQMAVSKALRGAADISEAMRERVMAVADRMGYQRNHLARALVEGRTRSIGVLMPFYGGRYFRDISRGVHEGLAPADYYPLLGSRSNDSDCDDTEINRFLELKVDGMILCPKAVIPWPETIFPRLLNRGERIVFVNEQVDLPGAVSVVSDDVAGAQEATGHLLALGHRDIAALAPTYNCYTVRARLEGYAAALGAAGLPCDPSRVLRFPDSPPFQAGELLELLKQGVTAFFCYNDGIAMQVLSTLSEAGLTPPGDYSLVGYGDDIEYADQMRVPLTTVNQSPEAMGREAARVMLAMLEDGSVDSDNAVPCRVVVRGSTGAPPKESRPKSRS